MEHRNHAGGYTLVELIVCLAVLLCLSSLLLPSLTGINTRREVNLKAWEIKRHLEYARNIAITHDREITLCTATVDYRCVSTHGSRLLVFDDTDNNRQWTAEEALYRDTQLGDALLSLSASWRSSVVRFQNTGGSKESGNFQTCMPGVEQFGRQVIFFRSGRIRLSRDSDRDGFDDRSSSPILCNQAL